jgi:RES domain-containing protein
LETAVDPPLPSTGVLDALEAAARPVGDRQVWRALVLRRHQDRASLAEHLTENARGARWNPPSTRAIYTSLEKETAAAEAAHLSDVQPRPIRIQIGALHVRLERVVDLSDPNRLATVALTPDEIGAIDHTPCRVIGHGCSWLGMSGLLVPSARRWPATNLVIYPGNLAANELIDVAGAAEDGQD